MPPRRWRLGGWRLHRRALPPEFCGVGPWRQIDFDRMIGTILGEVTLSELLSYFIGSHTNYGVLTRIEVLRKLEEFYADRAFFERAGRTANRVLDDILKELPASFARAKRGALQQTIEFRPYCLRACLGESPTLDVPHPGAHANSITTILAGLRGF